MSSCFGFRKSVRLEDDHEPLLPRYADDTTLQRRLHQKLHTYQMLRALSKGYMPSTEQVIINLRTLLASDVLNVDDRDLSDSGRLLVKHSKQWLQQFIELLRHKNDKDQVQDMLWYLSKSRVSFDVNDVAARAKQSRAKADTLAAYQSLRTVGSLLLTNSDFRRFLGDINIITREVFKDSAFKLSSVAEEAGKRVEPSAEEQRKLSRPGADGDEDAPVPRELGQEVAEVGQVLANGTAEVSKTAVESAADKLQGDEGKTLVNRLQQVVLNLRQRTDYSESVSTLSLLLKRYAYVYSRAAGEVLDAAQEDTNENAEMDRAMANLWSIITSFGDKEDWQKCEELYHKVLQHKDNDPEFEQLMIETSDNLQKMMTEPDFWNNAQEKFQELRKRGAGVGKETSLRQDVDALLGHLEKTLRGVLADEDINGLITTSTRIIGILFPPQHMGNTDLVHDLIHTFTPLLISAIQYVPIPRLEVSTPEIDLLLENLIIEPGHTVNHTSFLPYRLKVETYNDLEIRKARFRTATTTTSLVTVKVDGLSAKADEVGFWLRTHVGLLRFLDEGITSFALDDRGIDVHVDVEIAKDRMEQILTLKAVRCHIHKLQYQMRKSKFSWLGWLFKPLLRPILRKVLEKQLATALADFCHTANRELLFARERLRATRISQPDDILTFFKAIAARLTPEDDPDVYTRVGVKDPGKGVFKGVYAPGSIVKEWEQEAERAAERVEDFDAGGWRNEIFDTHVATMT